VLKNSPVSENAQNSENTKASKSEKIAYNASSRNSIFANFAGKSFSTATGVITTLRFSFTKIGGFERYSDVTTVNLPIRCSSAHCVGPTTRSCKTERRTNFSPFGLRQGLRMVCR